LMLNHPAVNRPVRTRMRGGVGSGGEKPPLTRLAAAADPAVNASLEFLFSCFLKRSRSKGARNRFNQNRIAL